MKKYLTSAFLFVIVTVSAQEHFSGINTSQRTGIINAGVNPAELANMAPGFEVNIFAISGKVSNNKIGFSDLTSDTDLEELLFQGSGTVDIRTDAEIYGPSVAFKIKDWGFAITSKAYAKLDLVDVDVNLGDALTNSALNPFFNNAATIRNTSNQRLIGTSWGEIGLSAGRTIFENEQHKFNGGLALKILFPGSYANFGAGSFSGTIVNNLGDVYLTDASANLNIAYSGNLGDSFTDFSDYTKSIFGKPNGFAADLGVNYQLKDSDGSYRLNVGLSLRNIGSMTFKSENNAATNYRLEVPDGQQLDLNQFNGAESLQDIESTLIASGYLNRVVNDKKSVKVKLPTLFSGYADLKVIPTFHISLFTQFKVKKNEMNDQITNQNIVSLTPRYTLQNFEVYVPLAQSEISGFSTGFGVRAYGFYVGSGSVLTALIADSQQIDAYLGYNFKLD